MSEAQDASAESVEFEQVAVPVLYVVDQEDWVNIKHALILQTHLVTELSKEIEELKREVANLRMKLSDLMLDVTEKAS